jgi:hypothetical protein
MSTEPTRDETTCGFVYASGLEIRVCGRPALHDGLHAPAPAPETPRPPAESSPEPPAGPERGTGEAGPEKGAQAAGAIPADLIKSDPGIRGGEPCITGTRIPVSEVASYLADGLSWDEVREMVPSLPVPSTEEGQ